MSTSSATQQTTHTHDERKHQSKRTVQTYEAATYMNKQQDKQHNRKHNKHMMNTTSGKTRGIAN